MRRKTNEDIVKALKKDFSIFGRPKVLLMDNGTEFKNLNVKTLCRELNIVQAFCMPYHPQGNSVSERVHRTLKNVMAKLNDKHPNRWPDYLQDCVRIINESVHRSLGTSPFFVHFGFHPLRTIGEVILPSDSTDSSPAAIKALVKQTLSEKTAQYRLGANRNRANDKVTVGEMVWVKNENPIPGTATKLNPHWVGPFKVIEVLHQDKGYVVENPFSGERLERGSERLKKCILREEILVNQEIVPIVPDDREIVIPDRPRRVIRPPVRYTP